MNAPIESKSALIIWRYHEETYYRRGACLGRGSERAGADARRRSDHSDHRQGHHVVLLADRAGGRPPGGEGNPTHRGMTPGPARSPQAPSTVLPTATPPPLTST